MAPYNTRRDEVGYWTTTAAATFPIGSESVWDSTNRPGTLGCRSERFVTPAAPDHTEYGVFITGFSGGLYALDNICDDRRTLTVTTETGVPLGGVSFPLPDGGRVGAPIQAAGACNLLGDIQSRTPAEARHYIRAVGCVPGRTAVVPSTDSMATRGAVAYLAVDGASASIVPRGTVVDIMVPR